MGVAFWDDDGRDRARGRHRRVRPGPPGRRSTATTFASAVDLVHEANAVGGRHGLGMSRPDREPDHRGQEPRHLRGAGDGAAAHRLRAAAQRDPQRGHHRQLPRRGPPARPADVRGPLARPAVADAPRVACSAGSARPSPARSPCGCAAARTTRCSTPSGPLAQLPPREAVDGAQSPTPPFGPVDRIGQLTMRNLDIADSRAKLEQYAAQGHRRRRARPSWSASWQPGSATGDRRAAPDRTTSRTTRSTAPRWSSGTD